MPLFCKFHSGLFAGPLGWHVHVHSSSPAYIVVVDATAALTVKVPLVWFCWDHVTESPKHSAQTGRISHGQDGRPAST
jgi:hypothetical protein